MIDWCCIASRGTNYDPGLRIPAAIYTMDDARHQGDDSSDASCKTHSTEMVDTLSKVTLKDSHEPMLTLSDNVANVNPSHVEAQDEIRPKFASPAAIDEQDLSVDSTNFGAEHEAEELASPELQFLSENGNVSTLSLFDEPDRQSRSPLEIPENHLSEVSEVHTSEDASNRAVEQEDVPETESHHTSTLDTDSPARDELSEITEDFVKDMGVNSEIEDGMSMARASESTDSDDEFGEFDEFDGSTRQFHEQPDHNEVDTNINEITGDRRVSEGFIESFQPLGSKEIKSFGLDELRSNMYRPESLEGPIDSDQGYDIDIGDGTTPTSQQLWHHLTEPSWAPPPRWAGSLLHKRLAVALGIPQNLDAARPHASERQSLALPIGSTFEEIDGLQLIPEWMLLTDVSSVALDGMDEGELEQHIAHLEEVSAKAEALKDTMEAREMDLSGEKNILEGMVESLLAFSQRNQRERLKYRLNR